MIRNFTVSACSMLMLIGIITFAAAQTVRTVDDAYGDWQSDAPGVMRRIAPADMPAPFISPSTADRSKVVARPADAELKTMPRFAVSAFAAGMPGARVLRTAPNGDISSPSAGPRGKLWSSGPERI